jgi:type IV pilus assembly protein PilV
MNQGIRQGFLLSAKRQSGVTLIEVLITLVVVSVGLLGMVAMQSISMKNAQGSHHHTLATAIAYDALDRVRLAVDGSTVAGNVPAAVLTDVANVYTAARFTDQFPGALVVGLVVDGDAVVVTVTWLDDRLGVDTGGGDVDTRTNVVRARSRLR